MAVMKITPLSNERLIAKRFMTAQMPGIPDNFAFFVNKTFLF